MRQLNYNECGLVSGGFSRESTIANGAGRPKKLVGRSPGEGLPPDEPSGLLGGLTPSGVNGAVAIARFNSEYAEAEVAVGDMLTFQSSSVCTITAQNGTEIATGELDIVSGVGDALSGAFELGEDGDWSDGTSEILTGLGDIASGFIDLSDACPGGPDQNTSGTIHADASAHAHGALHIAVA